MRNAILVPIALAVLLMAASPALAAPLGFAPAQNYGLDDAPGSGATADFDGKNGADLAFVNFASNTVSVLLNDGDGTFAAAKNYAAPDPYEITAADMDDDGDQDLAVANFGQDNVSVLLNGGSGAFEAAQNFATGDAPSGIAAADFDGDGKVDLATANQGSNGGPVGVSVLHNTTGTSLSFAAEKSVSTTRASGVGAADFDSDGKVDLAAINTLANQISVLRNTSTGATVSFAAAESYAGLWDRPQGPVVADFEGDGDADLATVNLNSRTISVLLNSGDGTFAASAHYATGVFPRPGDAADFDGDGKVDLAIANQDDNGISILPGKGDGTFGARVNFPAGGNAPLQTSVADFDADGDADLATSNRDSDNASVLMNTAIERPLDITKPELSLPGEGDPKTVTERATSPSGAAVAFAATATDEDPANPTVECASAEGLNSGDTFPVGETEVKCSAKDAAGNEATGGFYVHVVYDFGNDSGGSYSRPLEGDKLNEVKAGVGVPVKFGLGGDYGLDIFATNYPTSKKIDCGTQQTVDPLEETVSISNSGLKYDAASSQYVYNWKTDKAWSGTCRQLVMKFADGTTHPVNFKFK